MILSDLGDRLEVHAPGKVNLFLEVWGVRPDGFHEIDTVFLAVTLYDRLTVSRAGEVQLEVRPAASGVPGGEGNLVVRAARALGAATGFSGGARLELEKRIPVGAGLGGGSSDAAAALVALDRLWQTGLPTQALADVAAQVGSDVPFFLAGGAARGRGRGERLEPLAVGAPVWLVLACPGPPLSTPEVYRRLDQRRRGASGDERAPDALIEALKRGDVGAISERTFNRLEDVAVELAPSIGHALAAVRRTGALAARVTGSGSGVFGIFPDRAQAETAARTIRPQVGGLVAAVRSDTPSG